MLTKILEKLRREPVLLTQAAALLVGGLAAFGLELTKEQSAWVAAVAVFVAAVIGRSKVTPTVDVGAERPGPDAPLKAGPASDVKTGDDVEVVPAETVTFDGFGAPIVETEPATKPVYGYGQGV